MFLPIWKNVLDHRVFGHLLLQSFPELQQFQWNQLTDPKGSWSDLIGSKGILAVHLLLADGTCHCKACKHRSMTTQDLGRIQGLYTENCTLVNGSPIEVSWDILWLYHLQKFKLWHYIHYGGLVSQLVIKPQALCHLEYAFICLNL